MLVTVPVAKDNVAAAFDSAFEEVSKGTIADTNKPDTSSPEPPPPADEPEPEPETETPAVEPETQDGEDDEPDALSVSAEELAQIKANPGLAKLYKGMNKAFTKKTMSLAAERQAQQAEIQLLAGLKNPDTRDATFAAIAGALGKNVAQSVPVDATAAKVESAVDKRLSALHDTLVANGFDPTVAKALAKSMAPTMTDMAKEELKAIIEAEVGPLKEATGQLAQQAWAAESAAELKSFWSAHKDDYTPEIEQKMAALTEKFPATDKVGTNEYLEFLLRACRPDKTVKQATKDVAVRMQKAAAAAEPRAGIQPARVASTPSPSQSNFGKRDIDKIFDTRFDEAWKEGERR